MSRQRISNPHIRLYYGFVPHNPLTETEMSYEAKKPDGPDPELNPEHFDSYRIRPERKPTPESEAYYEDFFSHMRERPDSVPTKKS